MYTNSHLKATQIFAPCDYRTRDTQGSCQALSLNANRAFKLHIRAQNNADVIIVMSLSNTSSGTWSLQNYNRKFQKYALYLLTNLPKFKSEESRL